MAKQLVDIAMAQGIQTVIAQTLPEYNASTSILQKLKFSFAGSVQHPDDGEVWEWHYSELDGRVKLISNPPFDSK